MRFALNHITAPHLPLPDFFALAKRLEITDIEIRNDLPDDVGTVSARDLARMADDAGITILTINGLYPFNIWSDDLAERARKLADYAAEAGIAALALIPQNEGRKVEHSQVVAALDKLRPILDQSGVKGLVEPLGFASSSLCRKDEAIAAMTEAGGFDHFALIHDTFHHHLAGEDQLYPHRTGLVHISGVIEPTIPLDKLQDADRGLVDKSDRLDNIGQIRALFAGGYEGPLSFEPFAPETQTRPDLEAALAASMAYLRGALNPDG